MTSRPRPTYPIDYPSVVREEPQDKLNLVETYHFHVRKAEHAKHVCDVIIAYHEGKARFEVRSGLTQLPYQAGVLGERYTANDTIFAKWSGKYRFHESRSVYLGQRILIEQQNELISLLQRRLGGQS